MLAFNPTHALIGVALTAALLTACGKSAPQAPTAKTATPTAVATAVTKPAPAKTPAAKPAAATTAPAAAAVPAPAGSAFRISAVTLGSAVDAAHQVTRPATHFAQTDKTIYASVVTTGSTSDTTLSARWNYLQGTGMLISNVTQRLASDGPATTTFTLQNPDLWPEGKYNVEISVDGKVMNTQAFTIGK
ncbi:MAG TPA: hypothetical protein VLZ55_08530 [Rhodanobacter sp.]|jgi:hypothetical protein|nr:hypothetical protein [Rhodanobacter sp.]